MPIYVYECPDHGQSEKRLPISEADQEQRCHCGKPLNKVMTAPTFKMKEYASDVVRATLNREHLGTPTRETALMAAGLEEPKTVFGVGM